MDAGRSVLGPILPFVSLCSLLVLYDDESWLDGFVCTPPDAVSTREMFS